MSGVFGFVANIVTTYTNNYNGYSLYISTNKASSSLNAKDMKHTLLSEYINGTSNTCSWNATGNTLTNTNTVLANNTWGFTLNTTNRDAQQFCQVPDIDSPLKIKSVNHANEVGDATDVFFGAKVDMSKPSGKYQTVVVYTAVAET
jgi:hypothetical protein